MGHDGKIRSVAVYPTTHVVAAFLEALRLFEEEEALRRAVRGVSNRDVLVSGMRRLGFETLDQAGFLQ